jgi:hypothetical protein
MRSKGKPLSSKKQTGSGWLLACAILLAACGKVDPNASLRTDEELFKYGSLGTESEKGIPTLVWEVLPDLFPKYLPEGAGASDHPYAAFGLIYEDGAARPIGFSERTVSGVPRVGVNCALCHTATCGS